MRICRLPPAAADDPRPSMAHRRPAPTCRPPRARRRLLIRVQLRPAATRHPAPAPPRVVRIPRPHTGPPARMDHLPARMDHLLVPLHPHPLAMARRPVVPANPTDRPGNNNRVVPRAATVRRNLRHLRKATEHPHLQLHPRPGTVHPSRLPHPAAMARPLVLPPAMVLQA